MSATPSKPDETEVQRMLALKRHEQPPPAFFQGFSEKVIDRIQTAGPAPRLTLRQRLSVEFYGVPIYICAAGVAVCGLLVAGLIGSLRVGPAQRSAASTTGGGPVGGEPVHSLVPPQSPLPSKSPTSNPALDGSQSRTPGRAPLQPARAALAVPDAGSTPGQ